MGDKQQIPVRDGLWVDRGREGRPQLIGSRCLKCGELFFPRKNNGMCSYCQSSDLENIEFATRGTVYSCTTVMQRPPVYYLGEVPYALGFVELPEGIRIETLFTECDADSVHIGMDVELVIEKLHEDEAGNDIITYKFRPVAS